MWYIRPTCFTRLQGTDQIKLFVSLYFIVSLYYHIKSLVSYLQYGMVIPLSSHSNPHKSLLPRSITTLTS
jgi:hypothetical protein